MSKQESPQAAPPRESALHAFLTKGAGGHGDHKTYPWYVVLWLTGVDYFSTLGYQPGIAFLAAGALSPVATAVLVVVTLIGALPTYIQVAKRSYSGQGSIAMLEKLLPGWSGKLFVLALLGFAATDFVITMTLSAADAAAHAIENPLIEKYILGGAEHAAGAAEAAAHTPGIAQLVITLILLALLAVVFLAGFTEAIGLAVLVGVPYILFNIVVIGFGLVELSHQPDLLQKWLNSPAINVDWVPLLLAGGLTFPKLALGMSGFETGVSVMPLVRGADHENPNEPPTLRITNTRRLLAAAAFIMSALLISSSLVTTVLIPAEEFAKGGEANGRALAYLAHHLFGDGIGTAYDFLTIAILWFAGASAMAGLLNLIPRYLPRFGMAPRWVLYPRPLVLMLFAITVVVTVIFNADVDAQGGAYATGVLVLMLSAAVAVALALHREGKKGLSIYFWFVTLLFGFTLVDNVIERPDGVIISSFFILSIVVLSGVSRWWRATELRVEKHEFLDQESAELFEKIRDKKIAMVPLRTDSRYNRQKKENEIRRYYKIEEPLAFLHIDLRKDRSDFTAPLKIGVRTEVDDKQTGVPCYVINVENAVAIANTVAYLSEALDPITIFLGLTRGNPMSQSLKYILWGEGETGIMVYQILIRYWESTHEDDKRPRIHLMSE
jgi:hypothetical protein